MEFNVEGSSEISYVIDRVLQFVRYDIIKSLMKLTNWERRPYNFAKRPFLFDFFWPY